MSDPYEREGAKAAIHTMQRELAEAREKATTAWSDNLILDSRNRQLERELSEAREEIEMLQIRSAAASMHHAHNMDEVKQQRDTLAGACNVLVALTEDMSNNKDVGNRLIIAWADVDKALAAVKGGDA